ncbi:MAG: alpha-amylase/4-alpha-glucanotransferase domain-containing protein, partial [Anaerolineales bacterium]
RWEVAAAQGGAPAVSAGGAPWFGTLLCLSLLARQAPDRALRIRLDGGSETLRGPGERAQEEGVAGFALEDRAFGFALDLVPVPAARLVTAPIETLQRSEDRLETVYQGTLFALCWPLETAALGQKPSELELLLSFREI